MSQESQYQRTESGNQSVTYAKSPAQLSVRKITLTVPLLHIKAKSRKYPNKVTTRGYYLNVPKKSVEGMDISDGELVELTIKKISK